MGEETFADYILAEQDWSKKLEIMFYLKKKANIYYNNSVVYKTLLAKMFTDYLKETHPEINIDENLVITARLLCDCKKIENSRDIEDIRSYAHKGAEFLATLGFDENFCRLCEGVNRYTIDQDRTIEMDILELTDNFGAMLLDRPERIGFKPEEALVMLQYRNLKDKNNKLLNNFIEFIHFADKIDA